MLEKEMSPNFFDTRISQEDSMFSQFNSNVSEISLFRNFGHPDDKTS